jgi:hypothetical protein
MLNSEEINFEKSLSINLDNLKLTSGAGGLRLLQWDENNQKFDGGTFICDP